MPTAIKINEIAEVLRIGNLFKKMSKLGKYVREEEIKDKELVVLQEGIKSRENPK